jgi:sirohydrochlorin ferrochelatase
MEDGNPELEQLVQAFAGAGLDQNVVHEVWVHSGGEVSTALDALLALAPQSGPTQPAEEEQETRAGWHSLPQDAKAVILSHLERQELAVFAITCRDARAAAREARAKSKAVTAPTTVTCQGLIGLCASYPKCASAVLLH